MRRDIAALLAVAALTGAACRKVEPPPVSSRATSLADSAEQVVYGARFAITDRGVRRADIDGDTAFWFNDNTRMVLRPLRGRFYSTTGTLDGVITAREGIYDTRLGTLEARGGVQVNTLDGKRLETERAKFDQRLNQISSDTTFLMSEAGRDVRGIGFTSDADLTSLRVTRLLSAKAGNVTIPK
jgi:LPS export ABC transporter protein LptC